MIKKAPWNMRKRCLSTVLALIFVFGIAVCNLAYWQFVRGQEMSDKAKTQQLRDTTLPATRGTIYDRNGTILAESATAWNIVLKPKGLATQDKNGNSLTEQNREIFAKEVSAILGLEESEVYEKTCKEVNSVTIQAQVESEIKDKLVALKYSKGFPTNSLSIEETVKRYYPLDDFAATVLGYVNNDGDGNYGVEGEYNEKLSGTDGRVLTSADAMGIEMNTEYSILQEPVDGQDLMLTIDEGIQHFLENALDQAMEKNSVTETACGIVIDVNTFEILAMSTRPGYNPNEFSKIYDQDVLDYINKLPLEEQSTATAEARNKQFNNKAISFSYEPGSVFKIVTASAALDEGAANLNNTYECPGYAIVNGVRINCNAIYGHGHQTFAQTLQNSCNPAFIAIGQQLGISNFCKYYESFGMTGSTGIDLVGELSTQEGVHYHSEESMGLIELASSSFGQSRKVTPLQMLCAMATVANGGYLGTPHVVSQVLDSDGNILETIEQTKRQVISKQTSDTMIDILENVVTLGGGKNAYIEGYSVAGKTGTSQKLDSDDKTDRIASFAGFAPADDPQVACIIIIDEPRGYSTYGSTVAAPVFKQVMQDTLPYLGIEKTYKDGKQPELEYIVPDVRGASVEMAKEEIISNGLVVQVKGEGDTVISQVPVAGTELVKNSLVVVYTDKESKEELVTIPDFTGKTPAQVNDIAKKLRINITLTGIVNSKSTLATKQSLPKNTKVSAGTVMSVEFSEQDII